MNLNHWHRVACLALLLPVMAASGCTGTDVLTSTTGTVRLELDVDNVPGDFRFETARFRIRQITVRPTDAAANMVLGDDPLGLMQNGITLNFSITEPNVIMLSLAEGTYILEQIIISDINFRDLEAPPDPEPPEVTCAEYIDRYRSGGSGIVAIHNFGGDIIIEIVGGAENVVRVEFDWGLFLEAMQTAWACTQGFECDPGETWCLVEPFGFGFNEATFNEFTPDFLSVN